MTRCRICRSYDITEFLNLGSTPLADSFPISKKEVEKQYPLRLGKCNECHLVQLLDEVPPEDLFGDDYGFRTGASKDAVQHFKAYADYIRENFKYQMNSGIMDIASNDGTFLENFYEVRVLGVDPVEKACDDARAKKIPSTCAFFGSDFRNDGFGLITANNVLAHIPDLHDFMLGVRKSLIPNGVFIAEFQYFPDLLFNNEFDHVYHEHHCFFSLLPIIHLAELSGLRVFDVLHTDAQGGSLRVCMSKEDIEPSQRVVDQTAYELEVGITSEVLYQGFQFRANNIRSQLKRLLYQLKKQGKSIAGYGASAKSTTLLNFCGITDKDLDFIADTTPEKFGKFAPGTKIPIVDQKTVEPPDYYLVLVWNYFRGIQKREKQFIEGGGKFILPIPGVEVI